MAGVGVALAMGAGTVVAGASMAFPAGTESDSHGDAVASAARVTCPHGPNGVHGECVSAVASSKAESEDRTGNPDRDNAQGHEAKDAKKDPDIKTHGTKR
jgi:hypothetical protein